MKIVTGRTGTPHITSDDDRANNAGTYGRNYYVLNINDCLSREIISSNEIKINSGELMIQGTHARIEYGTSESVNIDDGQSGYKRIDLIVARYQKLSGMESVLLKVIKGTPATNNPTTPERNKENILKNGSICDMPLYKVHIDGVNITEVEQVFTIIPSSSELSSKLQENIESTRQLQETVESISNDVTQMKDDIKLLQDNQTLIQQTIPTMQQNIQTIQDDIKLIQDNATLLTQTVTQLEQRVSALEGNSGPVTG